jgi:hypothetical protein
MIDPVLSALLAAIGVAAVAFLLHRSTSIRFDGAVQKQLESTNAAEKQVHLKEMEFLGERNKLIAEHADAISAARALAFEEGKKQGRSEQQLECARQLVDQRTELSTRLESERDAAVSEAREKQRAEYELQQKLFSVKISPYVQLLTDEGWISNSHEAKVGYQYQLLVNGIPAFQPHVMVERHEKIEKIDQAAKSALLSLAQGCAEVAAATYLGVSPQFAKLAPGIIESAKKK